MTQPGIQVFGESDRGRVRRRNEDAWLIDHRLGLYAVADGMGGHRAGHIASRMAVDGVAHHFSQWWPDESVETSESLNALFAKAVQAANDDICRAAEIDPALHEMGTTFTGLIFQEDGACMAHIGDSRAYRVRNSSIEQLSEDHTYVNELIKAGTLTPEEARFSPYRHHLSRALGFEIGAPVDIKLIDAMPGDEFLLCSDGLVALVDPDEILEICLENPVHEISARLVDLANQRGGIDNITVIVLSVRSSLENSPR